MPPRILIVDDRPEVLKSLRRNIQEREKLRGCHDNVLDASGVQGARTRGNELGRAARRGAACPFTAVSLWR